MTGEEDDELVATEKLLQLGSEIAGGVAGTAMGFLTAGPPGALAGAAAAPLLTRSIRRVGGELLERVMGHRQRVRMGAALAYAIEGVEQRLEAGEPLREDDFLSPKEGDRSAADEITEGVLIAAQDEFEERKLKHLGRLLAALAFDDSIDRGSANHLVHLTKALSYRQLVLLRLATLEGGISPRQRTPAGKMVGIEISDLDKRGLLAPDAFAEEVFEGGAIFFFLSALGSQSARLLSLAEMPEQDVDPVRLLLRFKREPGPYEDDAPLHLN